MHVGTDFLKLPPVTGQYWSLFQCSMLGTGGTCVSRPRVRTAFTEALCPGVPSTDIEPLKLWAQQLPAPSPEVVHITVSHVNLLGKIWMHWRNQMLRQVYPALRAVRFCFRVAAVQDLVQQSSGKLIGTPHRVRDTGS